MVVMDITIIIYTNYPEVPYTLLNGLLLSKELSNLPLSTPYLKVLQILSK